MIFYLPGTPCEVTIRVHIQWASLMRPVACRRPERGVEDGMIHPVNKNLESGGFDVDGKAQAAKRRE